MASRKYYFSTVVYNNYLAVSKEIKAATKAELNYKVLEQQNKWQVQEERQRERERINDLKEQAEYDGREARDLIGSYENILENTLHVDDKINWETLKELEAFGERIPSLEEILVELSVPKESKFTELIFKSKKVKRLEKEEEAKQLLVERIEEFNEAKEQFEQKQKEHNNSIEQFKIDFESGHGEAIEKYVYIVLERSSYPRGFEKEYEVQFDPISGTIIVSFELPSKESMPHILDYKFVASRKEIVSVEMKKKDFDAFYEDCLYKVCLRSIHEIFESIYIKQVNSVVFNGWVNGIDQTTGNDFRSCIMSCRASREEFESFNLLRVNPKECFKKLRGLSAGPLSQLAPVRPIMNIDKSDARFVESREVLANINSVQNLATMDWGDFEHLVRELFEKLFAKDGGEVKVTQASRDGGVDAVVFDPDPIRGGKFVIQAKRYNNVVPVSAVRDLYGTLLNEGAAKGILVTTSYYGNDSREFAKDKPLTLIDGSNLIYMFQEHGYNVAINLQSKSSAK